MYFRALLDECNGAEILPKISDSIPYLVDQKKEFSGRPGPLGCMKLTLTSPSSSQTS